MPVYDFICSACELIDEDVPCSVADIDKQVCPACGRKMEVKIAPVGAVYGDSFFNGMPPRVEIVRTTPDGKEYVYKDLGQHIKA